MAAAVAAAGADEVRRAIVGATYEGFTGEELVERLDQFVAESTEIIPAAAEALRAENMGLFGDLVARSQHLTETKLKNQVDEQIFLARTAREQGAVAASAFGAGFGGSVWSLVAEDQADGHLSNWSEAYHSAYPQHEDRSGFFLTRPASSAIAID